MTRIVIAAALLSCLLTGCGGGAGAGSGPASASTSPTSTEPATLNALPIVVDRGPAEFVASGQVARNVPYTSVTICTPGSTTACQTIDHILVDTASVGLRIIASVLDPKVVPLAATDGASGKALRECVQFADGTTWGSVVMADVEIAKRAMPSLRINLMGDSAAGPVPSNCVSGAIEDSVTSFGARGVLGIGHFLQDCGPDCATRAIAGGYCACVPAAAGSTAPANCIPTAVALQAQVPNPVTTLSSDNNGVMIVMAPVASPGAASSTGTLYFGVGMQPYNLPGSAAPIVLDAQGTFTTTHDGVATAGSFVDSGSNGLFFASNLLARCADANGFYCPANSNVGALSLSETAILQGVGAATRTASFNVDNADQLFAGNATALPGLAGPNAIPGVFDLGAFDWGVPFFYGRSVYLLFEGQILNGTAGPALGF